MSHLFIKSIIISTLFVSPWSTASSICNAWNKSGVLSALTHGAKMALKQKGDATLEATANAYATKSCTLVKGKKTELQCFVLKNVAASLVDGYLEHSAFELCRMYAGENEFI